MPDNPQSESPKPSRRSFLSTTGSTAAVGVVGAYLPVGADIPVERNDGGAVVTDESNVEETVAIALRINGKEHHFASILERRCSIACANICASPAPRRAATMANAARARSMWTAGA